GMAAIATTLLTYLRPNDVLLMSQPLYGGTETLIEKTLPNFGIRAVAVAEACDRDAVMSGAARALAKAREGGGAGAHGARREGRGGGYRGSSPSRRPIRPTAWSTCG